MQIQTKRPWLKNLQTINAGEDVEKRDPSYAAGGNIISKSHYGDQKESSLKIFLESY